MTGAHEHTTHEGDVIGFSGRIPANRFIHYLKQHIEKRKLHANGHERCPVHVGVYLIDPQSCDMEDSACQHSGEEVLVFLDEGAQHACTEFGVQYSPLCHRELPDGALPAIDEHYVSTQRPMRVQ